MVNDYEYIHINKDWMIMARVIQSVEDRKTKWRKQIWKDNLKSWQFELKYYLKSW